MKTIFLAFFTVFILPLIPYSFPSGSKILPTPTPTPSPKLIYIENVPFTSQAPFGDWNDPREQDGCEETASIIAVSWAENKSLNKQQALDQIFAIAAFEKDKYGQFTDTSAIDTQFRIIRGYFNFTNTEVTNPTSTSDLITPLIQGKLIIVPTNGRLLNNPNYTAPGPERHNLVIRGYDYISHEFITNDPGTRKGENYRYPEDILFNALRDYPTGEHLPITTVSKTAILVSR